MKKPHWFVHTFFDAVVKINVYMNVTNNYIENDESVTEEDKKGWKKVVLPIFLFLYQMFLSWATSDAPVSDMQIIQQFDVEVIEDYQSPLETTDIELINEEDM